MGIMIGTISTGTINTYNSQAIKTKFVIIGVPLFPVSSYYKITDNMGIPIPINKKSVWVGYSRTTLLAIGALLTFASSMYRGMDFDFLLTALGVGLFLNGVASWILYWNPKGDEERIRSILSKSFDYNMLPDYLPEETRVLVFKELLKKYNVKYPNLNWEEEIRNNNINDENAYILFSLAYYVTRLTNDGKYNELLNKTDNYLKNKENAARSI